MEQGEYIARTGHALKMFAEIGEAFNYLVLKSAVVGMPLEDAEESVYDDADVAILSYLSEIGVTDQQIEELVGNLNYSEQIMKGIAREYAMFTEEDIDLHASSMKQIHIEEVTLDAISPPRCKSGYKRKLVVKNGKPVWKCIRLLGRHVKQTPKQKQALRKARMKAHTGAAKYNRARSVRVGHQRGIY